MVIEGIALQMWCTVAKDLKDRQYVIYLTLTLHLTLKTLRQQLVCICADLITLRCPDPKHPKVTACLRLCHFDRTAPP